MRRLRQVLAEPPHTGFLAHLVEVAHPGSVACRPRILVADLLALALRQHHELVVVRPGEFRDGVVGDRLAPGAVHGRLVEQHRLGPVGVFELVLLADLVGFDDRDTLGLPSELHHAFKVNDELTIHRAPLGVPEGHEVRLDPVWLDAQLCGFEDRPAEGP